LGRVQLHTFRDILLRNLAVAFRPWARWAALTLSDSKVALSIGLLLHKRQLFFWNLSATAKDGAGLPIPVEAIVRRKTPVARIAGGPQIHQHSPWLPKYIRGFKGSVSLIPRLRFGWIFSPAGWLATADPTRKAAVGVSVQTHRTTPAIKLLERCLKVWFHARRATRSCLAKQARRATHQSEAKQKQLK
jgi:hypothetical protein